MWTSVTRRRLDNSHYLNRSALNQKYLISIIGPTAIGKTALSIALAQHFKTEILSADSRQFYREMQIGTAAPSQEELNAVPHHFIHHKSIKDTYNVGSFEKDAVEKLSQLFKNSDTLIMVGGSGLYIDAVTHGLDHFPEVDPEIRETLNSELSSTGITTLQDQLKTLDPLAYQTIALDNPHRLIRALEISIGSGKPYSSFLNQEKPVRDFKTITIGLTAERSVIYDRINKRVDMMMEEGLLDEVRHLESFKDLNALKTVGYSEIFKYLNSEWTLPFAISEIKKNSRRYAKRQLTWFRKKNDVLWFDYRTSLDQIIAEIQAKIALKD